VPSVFASDGVRVDVRVPAKVNLFLAVRGLRDDGYHELVSIMQTISLRDRVTARIDGDPSFLHPAMRQKLRVEFTHDGTAGVPDDGDNLVVRAAKALLAQLGGNGGAPADDPHALVTRLHLEKEIPVAAGMAGGSADAAAALLALNALWDAGLERDDLRALAADLGADVPFCVTGGTALATGTGTATAQVLCRGTFHWVVGMSSEPLSTPAVYRTFDERCQPSRVEPDVVLHALRTGDAEILGAALHNDLEEAAFHLRPGLRDARDQMLEAGALGAVVSGSGPTLLALAEDRVAASRIHAEVKGMFDRCEVATSPSGGPTIG
jgi:4-diphosphocytidyl-2-C-methyl-D-erythritol kinase